MRILVPLALLWAAGCNCTPDYLDCQVRCGPKSACPDELTCTSGFCRVPDAGAACECRLGETRPCGNDAGECAGGVQKCGADHLWAECLGEGIPVPETCDGKDNDCNGMVDDAPVDAQACEKKLGVCAGKVRSCVNGAYPLNCPLSDYGPDYEAAETKCDGKDNDCDGRTDALAPQALGATAPLFTVLGFNGGFGLATARPDGAGGFVIEGTVYDGRLKVAAGPVQLAAGTGAITRLSGLARGDRSVVTWGVQPAPPTGPVEVDGVEWSRLLPNQPTRLAGLPLANDRLTGAFSAGLTAAGIVGAHLLDDGGAEVLVWLSAPLAPMVLPFTVPGATLNAVDAVVISQLGASARWLGSADTDAGTTLDGGVVSLSGGRTSTAIPLGPLLETNGALQSAWGESQLQVLPVPLNQSQVVVQYDAWDGGAFVLKQFPDYRAVGNVSSASTPTGLFLGWTEYGVLNLGTPTGGTNVRILKPVLDGGAVLNVQVANGGASWNMVGWDNNGLNAMLVCAP